MKKCIILFVALLAFTGVRAQTDTTLLQTGASTVILLDSDLDEATTANDVSSLLQSSRDVFLNTAGYNFGQLRFRIRGNDSKYTSVFINGVPMNDSESGRAFWSNWGGLNDAMRNTVVSNGIEGFDYAFGNIGGSTQIITRAGNYRNQSSVSYARSNRSYNNRIMATSATGMMNNGWAFVVSGSRRWSQEGYIEGTWYDAWSYFFAAEKRFSDKQSLAFTAFGAPTKRATGSATLQEVYDLMGTNYYNPNWGYQNGEKRNARVSNYHQPMFQLTDYWTPSEKTSITTTAYYWFGRGGSTALEWNYAADPRPDYYRNLPSYLLQSEDFDGYYDLIQQWQNDSKISQLDWDYFYFANSDEWRTIHDANGIEGNTITGKRSKYIVEERRNDKNQGGININLEHVINPNLKISGGLNGSVSKTHYYKLIDDLLGGDFYLDIDKYGDSISDMVHSDLNKTNRVVREGDIFGYDYIANVNKYSLWGQTEYNVGRFGLLGAVEAKYTEFWREGKMKNGNHPNNSFGDSEKSNFFDYGVKAGVEYGIDGRNYLVLNAAYITQAPQFRDAFISPRTRNSLVNNLESEKIFTGDISYVLRAPKIKGRLTAYHTKFNDKVWVRSFYHEGLSTYVNYIMSGIEQVSQGLELGVEAYIDRANAWSVTLAGAHGQHIYTNRPSVTISEDNSAELLAENRKVYIENYYVGGAPQTAASVGLKYNSPKFWFAGLTANYFDNMYFEPNPDKLTEELMSNYYQGDVRIGKILGESKLDPSFTLDFFGGKSWIVKGYYIALNVSINNILNDKGIVMSGYEQLRLDTNNPDRFPAKYSYLYGINYFISLTIRK